MPERATPAELGNVGYEVFIMALSCLSIVNLFLLLPFMPHLKALAPLLGREFPLTSEKARRMLGFSSRPAATTIVDCAESLL